MRKLVVSGNGSPKEFPAHGSVESLSTSCWAQNQEVLKKLREDCHSQKLADAVASDVSLGRMTAPVAASSVDLEANLLIPRFAVEQMKDDGSLKIRPIDMPHGPASMLVRSQLRS